MFRDPHAPLKLARLKRHLWIGVGFGLFFCAFPALDILTKGWVGGGLKSSGRIIRKSSEPRMFYSVLAGTQIPGVAIIAASIISYRRRMKSDL